MRILSVWGRAGAQVLAVGMVGFLGACGGGGSEGEELGTVRGESIALDARESALSVSKRPSTPVYRLTDLGTLGGPTSEAIAINERSQVTGTAVTAVGVGHPFLYNGNGMQDLGELAGPPNPIEVLPKNGIGFGINNRGQVVGGADRTGNGAWHAFIYTGGMMQAPPSLAAHEARDINDRGQIVGIFAGFTDRAFLWQDGVYQEIGGTPTGDETADAMAINARGQIAGFSSSTGRHTHAFLYSDGSMRDLGTLGGNTSHGFDVNAWGWVVGESKLPGDTEGHAFLHDGRRMRDLGSLGGNESSASAINDSGQVVGSSNTSGTTNPHAFVWSDGFLYDLNGLLDNSGSEWTLLTAADINNLGQIVGTGLVNGTTRAYLLTPVERGKHRGRWSGKEGHVPYVAQGQSKCSDALTALVPHKCRVH
jgi:probable HAF family extracellular repeat protein